MLEPISLDASPADLPPPGGTCCDICVVGSGAAGLFAAIFAARALRAAGHKGTVIAVDGAKKLGAKILVAGGGRCNVTHAVVDELQYAGTSRPAIRKVLGRFPVARTIDFFAEQGVTLKREDTGKLFPTTDDAQTVLAAVLAAAKDAGVQLWHPWRVRAVEKLQPLSTGTPASPTFRITREDSAPASTSTLPSSILATRLILATGGMSLPRTGSDGAGYSFAKHLGHTITPQVFPSLVPLLVAKGHWITELSGVSLPAQLSVVAPKQLANQPITALSAEAAHTALTTTKPIASFTNSVLLTHFGVSGPAALDISRYWSASQASAPQGLLCVRWVPHCADAQLDELLTRAGKVPLRRLLADLALPERLATALLQQAQLRPEDTAQGLQRSARLALVRALTCTVLPIVGDRGFTFAEVTAGGVPLTQVRLDTMESRVCPALHLCGELLDVDGRVGGFNFQWAWASGFIAGEGAAAGVLQPAGSSVNP